MKFRTLGWLLIAVLLAACGGANNPTSAPATTSGGNATGGDNSFSIAVTGDTTFNLLPASAVGKVSINKDAGTSVITFANEANKQSVSLVFWGMEPTSGTFPIVTVLGLKDGKGVTALLVDNARNFTANDGTLTLDIKDGKYSGSFNFTATGGEIGGNMKQNATVNGSFNALQ